MPRYWWVVAVMVGLIVLAVWLVGVIAKWWVEWRERTGGG